VRYHYIKQTRQDHPLSWWCDCLGVSRSGYHSWLTRQPSQRDQENAVLVEKIEQAYRASRGTYGYPRIHAQLRAAGETCGKHRIARLMQRHGIVAKTHKRYRRSALSKHYEGFEANKLNRQFRASGPNQRWVSDITYLPTLQGEVYLAAILDLHSRAIVGWSMSHKADTKLVQDALSMALGRRGKVTGLLLHSDQGCQYRAGEYQSELHRAGIESSMSRKGNCLDNAVMESFFHTLKTELTHQATYRTRAEVKQAIFEYIEVFYNRQRRHSYLNYEAPLIFEAKLAG